jgi:hypothetical protein
MKKIRLITILILATIITPTLALAKGPANKATGEVWYTDHNDRTVHVWFVAFETEPAKGEVHFRNYNQDGTLFAEFHCKVTEIINIDEFSAHFKGEFTYHNLRPEDVGTEAQFYVEDNGEPNAGNDVFTWGRASLREAETLWAGNIQLHYRS